MSETTNTSWIPDAPLLLSIPQTAALLGISERTTKRLIARRELVSRKIGSRTLVPRTSVENFLRRDHETETPEQKKERRRKADMDDD
jgi:excisionase family DNA binding protein